MSGGPLLTVTGIEKHFGGLHALDGIDLTVKEGEIVGLIGPNGAGKTTLFHVIAGSLRADRGTVRFAGEDISGRPGHAICRLGLARTYQTVRPFLDLSVQDNVVVGAHFGSPGLSPREERERVDRALALVGLTGKAALHPRQLTLVDRKLVELARALATNPRLLLLDEIISGLNPTEMLAATNLIKQLRGVHGITIVWVEHVMRAVMNTCPRVVMLNLGKVLIDGSPQDVVRNPEVIRAYLGEKGARAYAS